MKKRKWKSSTFWLIFAFCAVLALFSAVHLPVMEVIRNNIRTGIDADAYFYSEVENFRQYEEAVAEKRQQAKGTENIEKD